MLVSPIAFNSAVEVQDGKDRECLPEQIICLMSGNSE